VLTFEFRGYQSTYADRLPPQDGIDVLARNDSFYRLLAKACAPDPDDRFQSADELREQMLGVLREVVAAEAGKDAIATFSTPSPHFQTPAITSDTLSWQRFRARRRPRAGPGHRAGRRPVDAGTGRISGTSVREVWLGEASSTVGAEDGSGGRGGWQPFGRLL
jgi:hypothetical protein